MLVGDRRNLWIGDDDDDERKREREGESEEG